MPVESYPGDIPDFDNNDANSADPITATPSGRTIEDDGYGLNDRLPSSHFNFTSNRYSRALLSSRQIPIKLWTGPGTFFFKDEQVLAPDNELYFALIDNTSTANFSDDLTSEFWMKISIPKTDFVTVRADGTAGFDTDFESINDALTAGKKKILVLTPKVFDVTAISTSKVVTIDTHSLLVDDFVMLHDSNSTPALNGFFKITAVTATTVTLESTITITIAGTTGRLVKVLAEKLTLDDTKSNLQIFGEDKKFTGWCGGLGETKVIDQSDNTFVKDLRIKDIHLGHTEGNDVFRGEGASKRNINWIFEGVNFNYFSYDVNIIPFPTPVSQNTFFGVCLQEWRCRLNRQISEL